MSIFNRTIFSDLIKGLLLVATVGGLYLSSTGCFKYKVPYSRYTPYIDASLGSNPNFEKEEAAREAEWLKNKNQQLKAVLMLNAVDLYLGFKPFAEMLKDGAKDTQNQPSPVTVSCPTNPDGVCDDTTVINKQTQEKLTTELAVVAQPLGNPSSIQSAAAAQGGNAANEAAAAAAQSAAEDLNIGADAASMVDPIDTSDFAQ